MNTPIALPRRNQSMQASEAPKAPQLLPHERLDVYQVAMKLITLVAQLRLPRGHAATQDQLRRAAVSIALNIAEGCGKKGSRSPPLFRDRAWLNSRKRCALQILVFCFEVALDAEALW